ncbi:GNAT family N-acetyltransferase [Clostridium uliginosum]|uniref:Acetyltransferase (GNAT) domain-containing protein n=1 Tax=Clostridium uliginosum TaxID=119641 RepID=A0A1I1MI87_9CLOT|nr:GNAT family N-acetyltransferase [Clostridium uliginosum]SFC85204.1 Acetyltransferase (GNAT) domain-containing protein [Clostridium uliginosum]
MKNEFRLANKKDIDNILSIFFSAVENMKNLGINQWDELYPNEDVIRNDIENNKMYILTINDTPVATIVMNEEHDKEYNDLNWKYDFKEASGKVSIIHRVCVDPNIQGKGIGKKIVMLGEEELIKQGYCAIRLDAFSQNPFALKLYSCLNYLYVGDVQFRKGKFHCFEKKL